MSQETGRVEYERKYIVTGCDVPIEHLQTCGSQLIQQGYLDKNVRVRRSIEIFAGVTCSITSKEGDPPERIENRVEISPEIFSMLFQKCNRILSKVRYILHKTEDQIITLDYFVEEELELLEVEGENQTIPAHLGNVLHLDEVTDNPNYLNYNIAKQTMGP